MQLNVKFHQFSSISSSDTVTAKFWRHAYRQTGTHFLKTVKSCSGHLKHVNPPKSECRKFSRIQYFLLMYIEENKKCNFYGVAKWEILVSSKYSYAVFKNVVVGTLN